MTNSEPSHRRRHRTLGTAATVTAIMLFWLGWQLAPPVYWFVMTGLAACGCVTFCSICYIVPRTTGLVRILALAPCVLAGIIAFWLAPLAASYLAAQGISEAGYAASAAMITAVSVGFYTAPAAFFGAVLAIFAGIFVLYLLPEGRTR